MSDDLQIEVGQQQLITRDAVREPSLFKLASGDLLLSFHVQPDVHFAHRKCLRLRKGETTWKPEPQRAHREQAIGQAQSKSNDGLVIANDIYTFERQPGQYVGSFFRSDDGGNTFTGPHESVLQMDRVNATRCPTEAHFPPEDHPQRHFYQPLPEYYGPIVQNASPMQGPIFWRYLLEKDGRCWPRRNANGMATAATAPHWSNHSMRVKHGATSAPLPTSTTVREMASAKQSCFD